MPAVPPIIVSPSGCGAAYDLDFVHAAAHVRIERQEVIAHQHLAGADARDRDALEPEVVGRDGALRAAGKDDALVGLGHGRCSSCEGVSSHEEWVSVRRTNGMPESPAVVESDCLHRTEAQWDRGDAEDCVKVESDRQTNISQPTLNQSPGTTLSHRLIERVCSPAPHCSAQ